jgi:hypothetical protein
MFSQTHKTVLERGRIRRCEDARREAETIHC